MSPSDNMVSTRLGYVVAPNCTMASFDRYPIPITPSVDVASTPTPNCWLVTLAPIVNKFIKGHTSDLECLRCVIPYRLGSIGILNGKETVDVFIGGTRCIIVCPVVTTRFGIPPQTIGS